MSIPPEARNIGTYFIMSAMSETEIEMFREITLHSLNKLITRMLEQQALYSRLTGILNPSS